MRVPSDPHEREAWYLQHIDLFAAKLSALAWNWKEIDGWELEVLHAEDRYVILNNSRQSGKSSILMIKAFYKAITTPNALILLVAEQRQSNEDIRKVRDLFKAYNKYLRQTYGGKMTLGLVTDNVTSMEFANGARIVALPASEKVRGYSAPAMVIIDEAAFLSDEVFIGLDPMLEVSQGQLILASTPNGNRGFFYHEWTSSPRYRRFKVPWDKCPRISAESIALKRITLGEAYVKQEFECQFLDDISSLFSERDLNKSIDEDEEVFDKEMAKINQVLQGGAELI